MCPHNGRVPRPNQQYALQFLNELGSWRLAETTGDVRASSFCFNGFPLWCNVLILICSTIVLLMTAGQSEAHYQTNVVILLLQFLSHHGLMQCNKCFKNWFCLLLTHKLITVDIMLYSQIYDSCDCIISQLKQIALHTYYFIHLFYVSRAVFSAFRESQGVRPPCLKCLTSPLTDIQKHVQGFRFYSQPFVDLVGCKLQHCNWRINLHNLC